MPHCRRTSEERGRREHTHTAQTALVFLCTSICRSNTVQVKPGILFSLSCSGLCFVSCTGILGFCWYSAFALRTATAVFGNERRCGSIPHPYTRIARLPERIAEREGVSQTYTHSHEQSRRHTLFTDFPKDTNCKVCRGSKVTRAPCARNSDDRADRIKVAERLGDMITADHKVLNEEQESRMHHEYAAVVVQELAAPYSMLPMQKPNQFRRRKSILRKLLRPEENPRSICTDNCLFFMRVKG